jgi:tetratricopeptide (TPR) repeat protein
MHKSTITKSLFLKGESSFAVLSEIAGALHLVNSQNALDCVARQIIEVARRARVSRDMELCGEASALLLSLPASQGLRSVAGFYSSLSRPALAFDAARLREAIARGADSAALPYVPRIILEVAGTYDREGELSEALRYYVEAAKVAVGTDGLMVIQAAESIALLRSDDGDHFGALQELERLVPIIGSVSHTYPHLYYEYLNNLAVVLNRAGRTEESRRAIRVALASPLSPRFPEWRETQREIEEAAQKEPRRSPATVTVVPALGERLKEAPARDLRKSPKTFVIVVVRLDRVGGIAPFRPASVRALASLLERYVKTVRIRDSP